MANAAAVLIGMSLWNARYAGPVNPKPMNVIKKTVNPAPQGSSKGWYVSAKSS